MQFQKESMKKLIISLAAFIMICLAPVCTSQTFAASSSLSDFKSSYSVVVDHTKQLPTGNFTYRSSKTSVATVSSRGTIKGKKVGTTTITIKPKNTGQQVQAKVKVRPKRTSIQSISQDGNGFKVSIKKKSGATKYQIRYHATNSVTYHRKRSTSNKFSITKLSRNCEYEVQARVIKKVNGVNYYSKWSTAKTVTTADKCTTHDFQLCKDSSSGKIYLRCIRCGGIDYTGIYDSNVFYKGYLAETKKSTMKKALLTDDTVSYFKKHYCKSNMSNRQVLKAILQFYVDQKYVYDHNGFNNSVLTLFEKGKSKCWGYARATEFLCVACDVPCLTVTTFEHAFNLVKMHHRWYVVDYVGVGKACNSVTFEWKGTLTSLHTVCTYRDSITGFSPECYKRYGLSTYPAVTSVALKHKTITVK